MTVLVAYGTTNGATGEIARWIGAELVAAGLAAEVRPAAEVHDVNGYEAVVLGAAVYMAGWHRDARAFAHRFAGQLAARPVWLFSSGPLDRSAEEGEVPPSPQAETALHALQGRGHVTFGGRLSPDAHGWMGFVARRMAGEGHGGDFRNPERVRAWTRRIAVEIRAARTPAGQEPGGTRTGATRQISRQ
jgi:menaquinone-dependent protoporphyrinogen oxidase